VLTDRTLPSHAARVAVPTYDRGAVTPAVVHLGVGGFHRAHQAMYFDDLAEHGVSTDWGVTGVSLRHRRMKDALAPQDGLFTVVERGTRGDRARVLGPLRRQLFAPEERERVLAALSDERTRLVTLTVTGSGYNVAPETGEFQADEPAVAAELSHPEQPATAFGYVVEALARRRRAGHAPFTVLSCDNVPRNGAVARSAVVGFARLRDEVLARWIEDRVAFPSSMVDRITPATTPADRALLAREFGVADRWPVVTEPFSQWIVEDAFCNDRPPLEQVGARFVPDVEPYTLAKTRLLNASHSALGYLGHLAGHRLTHEAMADPALHDYLARLMEHEVAPLLPVIPGFDMTAYRHSLLARFANPRIGDQLARLCARGSTKMPAYLLPSLREARRQGRPHELLTLALAAWLRYLRGVDLAGRRIELVDARAPRLQAMAAAGGNDPRPLLSERAVFGDLGDDETLVAALERALERLDREGPHAALAERRRAGVGLEAVA
jgi:fructuronate reductase/mannitol 2-dehydrogenase